jgi:hypothetical protein
MRLLILQAIMSVVYIFDVSTYPFIHVPFYALTLLYFASILEIYGLVRLGRYVARRLSRLERRSETARKLVVGVLPSLAQLS